MAGIMLAGTSEATAQTNKTPDKNPEKTEVKTEISNFYNRLQESKVIPISMTAVEFQEKAKDKECLDVIVDQYRKAKGMMSAEEAKEWEKNNPNAQVIKKIKYGLDIEEVKEFNKVLTEEQREQELKNIWKLEAQGKLKIGDSVTLSNGEVYILQIYKPNTFKKSESKNNSDSDSSSSFKLMKDYVQK